MRAFQSVIKFFALCLAGVIIISIFVAIVGAFAMVGRMIDSGNGVVNGNLDVLWESTVSDAEQITKLEIKTGASNTKIIQTNESTYKLETNKKNISSRQIGNTLYIEEESEFIFSSWFEDGDLVIYVPQKAQFSDVKIDAGAGAFKVDKITTNSFDLDVGAGKTEIDELFVRDDARISGGAGVIDINDGKINNLQLELGAGKTYVRSEITGNSKVEAGVGKLDLVLLGGKNNYKFSVDKGIGSVTIDGVKQNDDGVYGGGSNMIDLESGVGAVEVRFAE